MLKLFKYYIITVGSMSGEVIMSLPSGYYLAKNLWRIFPPQNPTYWQGMSPPRIQVPKYNCEVKYITMRDIQPRQYYYSYALNCVVFKLFGTDYMMSPELDILPNNINLNDECSEIPFPTMPKII